MNCKVQTNIYFFYPLTILTLETLRFVAILFSLEKKAFRFRFLFNSPFFL